MVVELHHFEKNNDVIGTRNTKSFPIFCRGQAEKEFRAEVEAIGHVRHKNLVRLLGYCIEGTHRYQTPLSFSLPYSLVLEPKYIYIYISFLSTTTG